MPQSTSASFVQKGKAFVSEVTVCDDCVGGKYPESKHVGRCFVSDLHKGQYAVDSSTACKACETGKYQELDVATEHECKFVRRKGVCF